MNNRFLFNDIPDHFNIGSFEIHYYSLTMLTGFILAIIISLYRAKRFGADVDLVEWFVFIVVPSSIIGARLWYVASEWEKVFEPGLNPFLAIIGFRADGSYGGLSGLSIQGGVIVPAVIGVFYFHFLGKKRGHSVLMYIDIILPSVFIGQVAGRWGNFFNHEILGPVTSQESLEWLPKWMVDNLHYPGESSGTIREPFFLYESFANFMSMILIFMVFGKTRRLRAGSQGALYILFYGIVRASMELFRDEKDIMRLGGIPISFVLALIYVAVGLLLLWFVNFPMIQGKQARFFGRKFPKIWRYQRNPSYWYGETERHRYLMNSDLEYRLNFNKNYGKRIATATRHDEEDSQKDDRGMIKKNANSAGFIAEKSANASNHTTVEKTSSFSNKSSFSSNSKN